MAQGRGGNEDYSSHVLTKTVPAGDDWQHEVKFDGFRVQIHKLGDEVEL